MAASEWQTAVVHTGGKYLATGPKGKWKKLEARAEGTALWMGQMPGCAQGTARSSGPAAASTRPGPARLRAPRALGEAPRASRQGALGAPAGLPSQGAIRRVPKALPGCRSQPRVLRLGGAEGRQTRPALREARPGPLLLAAAGRSGRCPRGRRVRSRPRAARQRGPLHRERRGAPADRQRCPRPRHRPLRSADAARRPSGAILARTCVGGPAIPAPPERPAAGGAPSQGMVCPGSPP